MNKVKDYLETILTEGLFKNYWFMTKQTMSDFYFILNTARVVESYESNHMSNENFGQYYRRFFQENDELRTKYPKQASSDNTYRNAITAESLGLFSRDKQGYDSGVVTDAFKLLSRYIKTFGDSVKYKFIIDRQIEKLCLNVNDKIQNSNDLAGVKNFPVMFLYKILFELYKRTGDSTLYFDEFAVFLVRAKTYLEWEDVLNLILEFRNSLIDNQTKDMYEQVLNDNTSENIRFDSLISSLSNIESSQKQKRNYIRIKNTFESIRYIENAIEIFENSIYMTINESKEMFNFMKSDKYFIGNLDAGFTLIKVPKNEQDEVCVMNDIDETKRIKGAENVILYGVPGAGKSWTIKHEYCNDDEVMERLVFHPDYTYSDFIGQILPKLDDNQNIQYEFTPGPFTNLLKKAYKNPEKMYYLVIEEVNRGNAPAIFGDIFQLLDRNDNGESDYKITNQDIAKIVYGENGKDKKVYIPSNMSILCTMNTSDQNVFTLDTAFQRRWNMRLIQNKFSLEEDDRSFAKTKILDTSVTWENFFTSINDIILSKNIRMTSAEDKRLGTHFVKEEDLRFDDYVGDDPVLKKQADRQNKKFAEKVLKYLWDDAFKFNKDEVFDLSKVNSLERVIVEFSSTTKDDRFSRIFKPNIYNALITIPSNNAKED